MGNNVIDIDKFRQQRSLKQDYEGPAEEEFVFVQSLPPIYEQRLNEENEKIKELTDKLQQTIRQYEKDRVAAGRLMESMTIPIEALARQISVVIGVIDNAIPEEDLKKSEELRVELGADIADSINNFFQTRATVQRQHVYQHEMYAAVLEALFLLLHDHRIYQITAEQREAGGTGEVHQLEDVQEDKPE